MTLFTLIHFPISVFSIFIFLGWLPGVDHLKFVGEWNIYWIFPALCVSEETFSVVFSWGKNMPPCDLPSVLCMICTLHDSLAFFQSFWHRSVGSLCGGSCPSSSWMAGTGFFILWVTAGSEGRRKHSWPSVIPRFVCLPFFAMLP